MIYWLNALNWLTNLDEGLVFQIECHIIAVLIKPRANPDLNLSDNGNTLKNAFPMQQIIENIKKIEHGFKHIIEAGDAILSDQTQKHFGLAVKFLVDESYQVRMLATYMLGQLSVDHPQVLTLMETKLQQMEIGGCKKCWGKHLTIIATQ